MRILIPVGAFVLLCGAVVLAFQPSSPPTPPPTSGAPSAPLPPSQRAAISQLLFVGTPAESLVAIGFTGEQLQAAVSRLRDNGPGLDAMDASSAQIAELRRQIRQAKFSTETGIGAAPTQTVAQLEQQVTLISAQLDTQRSALVDLVLLEASSAQRTALGLAKRAAELGLRQSLAFAAATDTDLNTLAEATKAETRSARTGETMDGLYSQALLSARANPQVVAADARLATAWPQIKVALSQPQTGGNP